MRAEIRRSCEAAPSLKRKRSEDKQINPIQTPDILASVSTKKIKLNNLDPIMMVPIGKKKTFKFSRPNGTIVQFNVDSLVDYLLATGDFHDPETRLPFSESDLQEIDSIARAVGLNKASVFKARKNTANYSDAKFRRDALLALERCAGDVISEMLDIAETYDPEEAQMELALREFPVFQDFYRQMKQADAAYAAKCMAHWRLFIQGPPNRPNEDEFGLIMVVSNFLKGLESSSST